MVSETVLAMEATEIPATAYRLGRRLDDRRPQDPAAPLRLDRQSLADLAGVSNWSSARKLLAALRPIIEWTADGEIVSVFYPLQNGAEAQSEAAPKWSARQNGAEERAEMERENEPARRNGARKDQDPRQNGAQTAAALQNGAADEDPAEPTEEPLPERNDPETPAALQNGAPTSYSVLVSQLVSTDPTKDQEIDPNYLTSAREARAEMERDEEPSQAGQATPKYEPHPEHAPQNKNEEVTTARLLQDPAIGIDRNSAIAIGKNRGIELVRRAVARYLEGKEAGQFRSAGIILTWLRQPDAYGLAHYPPEFERSELFRKYRTGRELSLERQLEEEAAQQEAQRLASIELDPARPLDQDPPAEEDQSPPIPADVEPGSPEAAYYLLRHQAQQAYNSLAGAGKAAAGDSFARLWLALEPAQLHKAEPGRIVLRYSAAHAANGHSMQRSRTIARRILYTITREEYEITTQIDPETVGAPESAAEADPVR